MFKKYVRNIDMIKYIPFLDAFAKLRNTTISFVMSACLPVRQIAW